MFLFGGLERRQRSDVSSFVSVVLTEDYAKTPEIATGGLDFSLLGIGAPEGKVDWMGAFPRSVSSVSSVVDVQRSVIQPGSR
jgi:hypothetical protein